MISNKRGIFWLVFLWFFYVTLTFAASDTLGGVWRGNVGKQKVTACFNTNEYSKGTGSYYYSRYLKPIQLEERPDSVISKRVYAESGDFWQLNVISDDSIIGMWSSDNGLKSYPVELHRVLVKEKITDGGWCGSDAYNNAIEKQPDVIAGPVESTMGLSYRKLSVNLGDKGDLGLSDIGLHISTIELIGKGKQFSAINQVLRKNLPLTKVQLAEGLFACRRQLLASNGHAGMQTETIQSVEFLAPRWLKIHSIRESNCSVNITVEDSYVTWDISNAKQANLSSWFKGSEATDNGGKLPAKLGDLIRTNLSKKYLEECPEPVNMDTDYSFQPNQDGIQFNFNYPGTFNGSCAGSVQLSFQSLMPFMTSDGKRYLAEILLSSRQYRRQKER